MAKPSRFKKIGPNEWAPVVNPTNGEILHVRYAENIGGGIIEIRGGQPRISDAYADKGFKLLADYYKKDADTDLQERGLGVYLDYQKAIDLEQVERKAQNGNSRATFVPCPEEWLPAAVLEMQAKVSKGTHTAPARSKAKPSAKPKGKGAAA